MQEHGGFVFEVQTFLLSVSSSYAQPETERERKRGEDNIKFIVPSVYRLSQDLLSQKYIVEVYTTDQLIFSLMMQSEVQVFNKKILITLHLGITVNK
jgi:hypothetical protein